MKTKSIILPMLFLLTIPLFSQANKRVTDNAGLLSSGEKESLAARLNSLSEAYAFDLVIVTENNIGNADPMNYADDFFDFNDFGFGSLSDTRSFDYRSPEDTSGRDGCLFLIVAGTRDYWFSTSGRAIDILKGAAYAKLESDAVSFLRQNNYYAAFNSFLDNWEVFLILDAKGRSYNFFYQWNKVLVIIGWLIAFVIGIIVVQVWKSGMNTVLSQTQAASYIVPGSLAFNVKTDKFLYSVVAKTARQEESSSTGTHIGSSGKSHGGGGGKY